MLLSHILAEVEALCDRVTIDTSRPPVAVGGARRPASDATRNLRGGRDRPTGGGARSAPSVHDLRRTAAGCPLDVDTNRLDEASRAPHQADNEASRSSPPTLEGIFLRSVRRRADRRLAMSTLAATEPLTWFTLRRDWLRIVVWIVAIVIGMYSSRGEHEGGLPDAGRPRCRKGGLDREPGDRVHTAPRSPSTPWEVRSCSRSERSG